MTCDSCPNLQSSEFPKCLCIYSIELDISQQMWTLKLTKMVICDLFMVTELDLSLNQGMLTIFFIVLGKTVNSLVISLIVLCHNFHRATAKNNR